MLDINTIAALFSIDADNAELISRAYGYDLFDGDELIARLDWDGNEINV